MSACLHCAKQLAGRRKACDDCQVRGRRIRERRRGLAPADHAPSRIRLPLGASTEERFWAKVEKTDACWLWTGSRNGRGYGLLNVATGASPVRAHRFSYELLVGTIPAGLQLDHLCGVKACVNPAHLEPVTNEENSRRARERLLTQA
jgi:hypothetical protein